MPRIPARDRLVALAEAATAEFGRLGYRGTRTAEVAAAARMSAGLLFTFVESKEALFHLVFLNGFGQLEGELPELPLAASLSETVAMIEQNLRKYPAPRMKAALASEAPADVRAELTGIVEERYDLIAVIWPLLAVIERSATDLPELEDYYFKRARVGYFERLTTYLRSRAASGHLRQMPDAAVAARMITEAIGWFAWKRHEGRDARLYDDELVRTTLVEFVCSALLKGD